VSDRRTENCGLGLHVKPTAKWTT